MHYIKLETDDDTTRWINLASVCRVTLSTESPGDEPICIVIFRSDENVEARVKIQGNSEQNRRTIEQLTTRLDRLAKGKLNTCCASNCDRL